MLISGIVHVDKKIKSDIRPTVIIFSDWKRKTTKELRNNIKKKAH